MALFDPRRGIPKDLPLEDSVGMKGKILRNFFEDPEGNSGVIARYYFDNRDKLRPYTEKPWPDPTLKNRKQLEAQFADPVSVVMALPEIKDIPREAISPLPNFGQEKNKFKNRSLKVAPRVNYLLEGSEMLTFFQIALEEILKQSFSKKEDVERNVSLFYLQHREEILHHFEKDTEEKIGIIPIVSSFPEIRAIPESEVKKFWSQEYEKSEGEWSSLPPLKKQNMAVCIRIDLLMIRQEIPIPLRAKYRKFMNSVIPTEDEVRKGLDLVDYSPSLVAAIFYLEHREEILSYLKS
jgi:hypothetical protein